MQVVILAGGLGTRISEESSQRPKPMIEIGEKPILWHIMKIYSYYGYNDFIICLGYKGYMIKEYFLNYLVHTADLTINFRENNKVTLHNPVTENWKITFVDTGLSSLTGGRVKRVKDFIEGDTFMLTYGDGVANVNVPELVRFHQSHGKLATLTAAQPTGRFGSLNLNNNQVLSFHEKTLKDASWVNAGFMVLNKKVIDYIKNDQTAFEKEPLEKLALEGNLVAYKHHEFWHPMDTLRDKTNLDEFWLSNSQAPWKIWK